MRLTTKGRFAVTAMIDVAMHGTGGPVTLAAVSRSPEDFAFVPGAAVREAAPRMRWSRACAARAAATASRAVRESMSVADIIVAVDEPIDATQCGGNENCAEDGGRCMTHELWSGLNAHIFAYLRSVSLADLVAQQKNGDVTVMHDHRGRRRARASRFRRPDVGEGDSPGNAMDSSMKTPIYLDYSARRRRSIRASSQKMIPWLTEHFGNPASRIAAVRLGSRGGGREGARARSRRWSGATRGDRLDLRRDRVDQPRDQGRGALLQDKGKHLVTVKTEHKAVLDTMRELEREGFEVTYLDVEAGRPARPRRVQGGAAPRHDPGVGHVGEQRDRRDPGHRRDRRDLPRARHHLPRRRGAGHRQGADRPRRRSRST